MAESAPITQYRQELVGEFEEGTSYLRQTTVTEGAYKGNQVTFLVGGSGNASAVTRGINGLIPARANSLTQSTATLTEWHDLPRTTDFNIFQSQGDLRRLMQMDTRKVLNRRIDADIIAQLDTATTNLGAASTMSLAAVAKAKVTLGENEVPTDDIDNMWAIATPAVEGYLMQTTEFTSRDYVDIQPLIGKPRRTLRWAGFNWVFHPNLTGVGTSSEKCYFYHRDAIGSAFNVGEMDLAAGHNDEQGYYYVRCSAYTGAKLLQQNGIVQFLHDASAI